MRKVSEDPVEHLFVYEGNFKNGQFNGFIRELSISSFNTLDKSMIISWYKRNRGHGYNFRIKDN